MGLESAKDPDQRCIVAAGRAITPELQALGAMVGEKQAQTIATFAVLGWLSQRPVEWSRDRSIAHMGEPDAYTVGFAETILPILADGDFPFDKPIINWSKEEMAKFLAQAFELIEEQRASTLETEGHIPY
jgi:hypothetical protein